MITFDIHLIYAGRRTVLETGHKTGGEAWRAAQALAEQFAHDSNAQKLQVWNVAYGIPHLSLCLWSYRQQSDKWRRVFFQAAVTAARGLDL